MMPADKLPLKAPAPPLDMLEGIRVLDLTTSIAGPFGGQLLADMGATVLKVEKPGGGDDARAWGPPFLDGEGLWFLSVNRNKQSLTLDIHQPEGHAVFMQLASKADVILVNIVERAQRKLGIDAAALRALHPALIHVSITGFGLDGARADQPCYDLIAEGYSGVMDLTGATQSEAQKVGTPAADLLAGTDAAMAVMAALIRRGRTGAGCAIDISMTETMTRFMTPRLTSYLGSGELPRRSGGTDSVIAIYQAFETADDPITLGLGNDGIWKRFWQAMGDPEFASRPEYAGNAKRREHRAVIVERIGKLLLTRTRAQWLTLFNEARIPAGPINRLDEVAEDAELRRRGLLYSVERNGHALPQIGLGIHFDGRTEACVQPAPRLGEHSDAVLRSWLSLPDEQLDALRNRLII